MPISALGNFEAQRTAERGLTLVELLVVIAIMGFASGAVLLTVTTGRAPIVDAALKVERDIASMRDTAVASVSVFGLRTEEGGYGRYRGQAEGWVLFETYSLPHKIDMELVVGEDWSLTEHSEDVPFPEFDEEDEDKAVEPEIVFSPEGSVTPFTLTLRDGERAIVLSVDGFGKVSDADF
ncbi:MAG: GspH/FimT family pseudopilin [Pseudomonadota bacterium]